MRKKILNFTQKDSSFSKNLYFCRSRIFKLRFADITAICGVPQATMQSYDEDNIFVSPFLKTAKGLADMYCTDIERLTSYDIWIDREYVLELQIAFINRIDKVDVSEYRDDLFAEIYKHITDSEGDVYDKLQEAFRDVIKKFCREGRYFKVKEDTEICNNFTSNYNKLISLCRIPYKKISTICDISTATLTRLKQGGEPNVTTLIKLSDFFGISISQLLSKDPEYDLAQIVGTTIVKTDRFEYMNEDLVPYEEEKKEYHLSFKQLGSNEAKEIVIKYLERIE